ncbi:pilus assembly protein [Tahibacter soli]|uniref:PilC/PilY family type IV pilus protein n=1 Tax=Tahibacter soli TaxID=2983605 RepID=A0A9X3YGI3_9GAMM|nr:PilC/PilY family type IV pilus protein [Tahibacter soli]MDC8011632.1 PilC/PilY family type IV pilus protein [Tahibacter soli]
MNIQRFIDLRVSASSAALLVAAVLASPAAQAGRVDLLATPPDITASVDPNLAVSFDDSGSMAWTYLGDKRPYDDQAWSGPWRCAGVIDAEVTDRSNPASRAMNGVYYNPNITYSPPLFKDGSSFPQADATLTAVWQDGIAANRPVNGVGATGTVSYANNPDTPADASASGRTNLMGTKPATGTDRRWDCDANGATATNGTGSNPFAGGGPYYYRYTGPSFVDASGNVITATLYNTANWTAVAVPASQYQNFANWYAYYRTRTLAARSALSRVFGSLGENIRVAWQTIWPKNYNGSHAWSVAFDTNTIISNLTDTNNTGFAAANNFRTNFFNWLYQVGARDGTPDREATQRAGNLFKAGSASTLNLTNPYFQPGIGGAAGRELSCRQNFHVLVTDGYWNGTNGNVATPSPQVTGAVDLPRTGNGTTGTLQPFNYSPSDAESRIYWDVKPNDYDKSLANVAFSYWANDLRTDLDNTVAPYFPDKSTNLDGTGTLAAGADPASNKVVFFNPANDPATWQHVVQFMVALGIDGTLRFPNDFAALRGPSGTGAKSWPTPAADQRSAVDDMWHAAINSRGAYFSASNPTELVNYLTEIINSILVRRSASTALTSSISTLTATTQGYAGGYDSSDWSGFLFRRGFQANGQPSDTIVWDAGCILTGGQCNATNSNVGGGRDPNSRVIATSKGTTGSGGFAFRWASLSTAQKTALNKDGTTGATDAYGEKRLDWARGVRTQETSTNPTLRRRSSLLGAIVNSRPKYLSAPESDYKDDYWPAGSAEATSTQKYSNFVESNRTRTPTVFVGSNDGMLHAFDAATGAESWAFVPNTVIANGRMTKMTATGSTALVPGVDDTAVTADMFFGGGWRTMLVGSTRMGGRGVFAIDVTNPAIGSEGTLASKVQWEITGGITPGFDNLGYTYASANTARVRYNNKWVAVISSGYFPKDTTDPLYSLPAASTDQSSLFVVDMETGALIKEIRTPAGITSYGLSTPAVAGPDPIVTTVVAGDLAGNLWRFDLSSADTAQWKAELMFKTYTGLTDIGKLPISVEPILFRDPVADGIWLFGTGKFLGAEDRTNAGVATQQFFGIRDYGAGSTNYPITISQLVVQDMTQSGNDRSLTQLPVPASNRGWRFELDERAGERDVVSALDIDNGTTALLTTLLPKGDDPCDPGRSGSIMIVNAANGGAPDRPVFSNGSTQTAIGVVGRFVPGGNGESPIPISGSPSLLDLKGGGGIIITGLTGLTINDPYWHRGAWRNLLDKL